MTGRTQDTPTVDEVELLPKAEVLRQLEEHNRLDGLREERLRKDRITAWKDIPRIWVVERKKEYYTGFHDEAHDGVYITHPVEPTALQAYTEKYGEPARDHGGMFYYRTDEGILTNAGGGTYMLQTPKLCSDAEWESILAGDIPAKFWRVRS